MRLRLTSFIILLLWIVSSLAIASSTPIGINQKKILQNAPTLNPTVLKYAINGYWWALQRTEVSHPNILTIIDFNLPANKKRLWVINLKTDKVLLNTFTTQGKKSGLYYARHFSNRINSDETSLGVYETLNPYKGEHGLSLRLQGLEKGINGNALRRAIVIHPAWYATPTFVKKYHRTGRSWGCFAVNPAISSKLIRLIEHGSILFAYASPEKKDTNLQRA